MQTLSSQRVTRCRFHCLRHVVFGLNHNSTTHPHICQAIRETIILRVRPLLGPLTPRAALFSWSSVIHKAWFQRPMTLMATLSGMFVNRVTLTFGNFGLFEFLVSQMADHSSIL